MLSTIYLIKLLSNIFLLGDKVENNEVDKFFNQIIKKFSNYNHDQR